MIKDRDVYKHTKGKLLRSSPNNILVASPSWLSTNILFLHLLKEMTYVFDEPRGESKYIIKGKRSLTYV